jgi:hypothetical protein
MTLHRQFVVENKIDLIGIAGTQRVGKNVIAEFIKPELNREVVGIADLLKSVTILAFSLPEHVREGTKDDPMPELDFIAARKLFQVIGSFFRYEAFARIGISSDLTFWLWGLDRVLLKKQKAGQKRFLITDVRHDDECDYIRQCGGLILQVLRPNNPLRDQSGHTSEQGITVKPDYLIINDGSLEELKQKAQTFLQTFSVIKV